MFIKLILLIPLAFLFSCSSLKKFGEKKYFDVKRFDANSEETIYRVAFWSAKENDQHCFKDNPKNKEIITVNADYIEHAITHFYLRVVTADVKIATTDYKKRVEFTVKDDLNFKLEKAYCVFDSYGGLFKTNLVTYVSFRLAD